MAKHLTRARKINIRKTGCWLSLIGAVLCGGCDKQTKINSEKIQILSQNILQFEQNQSRQMAAIQSQLTALAPMLDRMNSSYFAKTHDAEFLYHTNTLYLLLIVDKKIEAHLQLADSERAAQNLSAFAYHTNETDLMQYYAAQILDAAAGQESRLRDAMTNHENRLRSAMAGQESRIEDSVNAQTRLTGANLTDALLKQIELSAVPDVAEAARRRQMEVTVAQIKDELQQIKLQLNQLGSPSTNRIP